MRQTVWYFLVALVLFSCQDVERPEKPDDLISQETMVALLTEVYLGNAARSIDNKHIRSQGVKIDSFLFAKFKVDSLQFVKSNTYYSSDIDTYTSIISRVQRRLETLKTAENAKKLKDNKGTPSAKDSLNQEKNNIANDSLEEDKSILVESVSSEL